jgi:hypothetical protein
MQLMHAENACRNAALNMTHFLTFFQGTLAELQRLTGWGDDRVLYFGDHPYADLADLVSSQSSQVASKMLTAGSLQFYFGINIH